MFEEWGIITVGGIVVICILVGLIAKASALENKWIPVVCGAVGGALGIVGMWIIPEFPATDFINSAAIGIASGLAATGAHQIYKQLFDNKEE